MTCIDYQGLQSDKKQGEDKNDKGMMSHNTCVVYVYAYVCILYVI